MKKMNLNAQKEEEMEIDHGVNLLKNKKILLDGDIKNISSMCMYDDVLLCGTDLCKLFVFKYDSLTNKVEHQKTLLSHCEIASQMKTNGKYFLIISHL